MKEETVRQHLYERYIEPTTKMREKSIGIEIEMPILNLNQAPVDFDIIHGITKQFMDYFQFKIAGRDEEGNIYSISHEESGDILSYDCSYNNLELSMGKERNLFEIQKRFQSYYRFLQACLARHHYTLSGMGVNPYRIYNYNIPIPNGRYRMLFHHLHSYKNYHLPMYFHEYPEYGTFCSASQVQLDVNYEDLIETIDTFSKLEPIKALLFSNSVLLGEYEELICCRDMFWENSTHGINPHNIGMFDCELKDIEDLQAYIASTSIYCVERGEKYINFPPVPILDYFKQETIWGEYYEDGEYQTVEVHPELDDIPYLRTFKFEDLTFRGTIEFRSVCCQPIQDSMTVAAFHVGLKEQLHALTELLEQDFVIYHHGYTATELRKLFVQRKLPAFVEENELYELAGRILDLAAAGLRKRGLGEEVLLQPLYERVEGHTNPARYLLERQEQGIKLEDIVLEYAVL